MWNPCNNIQYELKKSQKHCWRGRFHRSLSEKKSQKSRPNPLHE